MSRPSEEPQWLKLFFNSRFGARLKVSPTCDAGRLAPETTNVLGFWHPHIYARRDFERCRHHSNHREGLPIQADRGADQVGITSEFLLPEPLADHNNLLAGAVFFRQENTAKLRFYLHALKESRGDRRAANLL